MRRAGWLCLLLFAVAATSAHAAATSPPGINLRWDRCYGDGGVMYKQFACDTNTGSERLVMSLELAAPFQQLNGVELALDLKFVGSNLPAWWQFKNVGTCRQSSLTITPFATAGELNCIDWESGRAAGGFAAYQIGVLGPNSARIFAEFAIPAPLVDLDPGQEYFLGAININHAKTIGTGSCSGCSIPVCLVFEQAHLITTPPVPGQPSGDLFLFHGANFAGSQIVGWQNGYTTNFSPGSPGLFTNANFDCVPYSATASRRSTWGQMKSLYH